MPSTGDAGRSVRGLLKRGLSARTKPLPASGATLLIYHRVGGGTTNELDLDVEAFRRQLDMLE